jgi:hypothetical protein
LPFLPRCAFYFIFRTVSGLFLFGISVALSFGFGTIIYAVQVLKAMLPRRRSKTTMKVSTRKSCCIQIYCNVTIPDYGFNCTRSGRHWKWAQWSRCHVASEPDSLFQGGDTQKKGIMDTIGIRDDLMILGDHDEGISLHFTVCICPRYRAMRIYP